MIPVVGAKDFSFSFAARSVVIIKCNKMACNACAELLIFLLMESIVIYISVFYFFSSPLNRVIVVATARLFQFNLSRSPINLLRIMLWAPRRQLAESLLLCVTMAVQSKRLAKPSDLDITALHCNGLICLLCSNHHHRSCFFGFRCNRTKLF